MIIGQNTLNLNFSAIYAPECQIWGQNFINTSETSQKSLQYSDRILWQPKGFSTGTHRLCQVPPKNWLAPKPNDTLWWNMSFCWLRSFQMVKYTIYITLILYPIVNSQPSRLEVGFSSFSVAISTWVPIPGSDFFFLGFGLQPSAINFLHCYPLLIW